MMEALASYGSDSESESFEEKCYEKGVGDHKDGHNKDKVKVKYDDIDNNEKCPSCTIKSSGNTHQYSKCNLYSNALSSEDPSHHRSTSSQQSDRISISTITSIDNTHRYPKCNSYNNAQSSEDTSHHKSTSSQQSDRISISYFGLVSNNSEMRASTDPEVDERQREVVVHGSTVEVPQGDFWKDFSADDIVEEEFDRGTGRKRVFKIVNKADQQSELKRPMYDKRIRQAAEQAFKTTQGLSLVKKQQRDMVHAAGSDNLASPSTSVKIKVYTVHPSISPHLHRQQDNKCPSKELWRCGGHFGVVNRIAWCSSLPYSHLLASAGADSTVRVWNAWGQHEPCVRTLAIHSKAVRDIQWSHDGRRLLTCSYDRTAVITDVDTGQVQEQLEHSGFVSCGKYHPVTQHLLVTGSTNCIQVWDIRHPDVPVRIFTHKEDMGQVQDLLFEPEGHQVFSCGDVVTRESSDRSIMAWDWRTGVVLSNQIFQERYTVTRLAMHPSQSQFLAQTQGGYIALFSTQRPYKMNRMKRFGGHKTEAYNIGLSLSTDGSLVYSGSSDCRLHCYNFNNAKRIRTLNCGQVVLDVAAHPVLQSVVAVATWEGEIVLFQ